MISKINIVLGSQRLKVVMSWTDTLYSCRTLWAISSALAHKLFVPQTHLAPFREIFGAYQLRFSPSISDSCHTDAFLISRKSLLPCIDVHWTVLFGPPPFPLFFFYPLKMSITPSLSSSYKRFLFYFYSPRKTNWKSAGKIATQE